MGSKMYIIYIGTTCQETVRKNKTTKHYEPLKNDYITDSICIAYLTLHT